MRRGVLPHHPNLLVRMGFWLPVPCSVHGPALLGACSAPTISGALHFKHPSTHTVLRGTHWPRLTQVALLSQCDLTTYQEDGCKLAGGGSQGELATCSKVSIIRASSCNGTLQSLSCHDKLPHYRPTGWMQGVDDRPQLEHCVIQESQAAQHSAAQHACANVCCRSPKPSRGLLGLELGVRPKLPLHLGLQMLPLPLGPGTPPCCCTMPLPPSQYLCSRPRKEQPDPGKYSPARKVQQQSTRRVQLHQGTRCSRKRESKDSPSRCSTASWYLGCWYPPTSYTPASM